MAGNIFRPRLLRLIRTFTKMNCSLNEVKNLSTINSHLLLSISDGSLRNVDERPALIDTGDHPKSWLQQYEDFIYQMKTHGIDTLDDKFLPLKKRKYQAQGDTYAHFIDFIRLKVTAGNGGDGNIHFLQLFRNANAGPSGGDGGNGGHVIFQASRKLKSLVKVKKLIEAKPGENGKPNNCAGKNAPDTIIEVPLGTTFKQDGTPVADLEEEGDMFIAARGGAGGKGNAFFKSSVDQAPLVAEYGGEGESFEYEVELRIMADIGLIGIPNAGKSTLLRAISRARPKVASYPFTTLNPHVGMVEYADYQQIAVADLPGLVKGSHSNLGLGMEFLKHVQRCSCLLFVLDASEENPLKQFDLLKDELEHYETGLSERPHAIVLNKMDLPKAEENFPLIQRESKLPVFPISAKMGRNIVQLLAALRLLSENNSQRKISLQCT